MSMVVEAVQECGSKHGRVGAELGPESRLTMPVGDFLRVKEALSPAEMVDGDWLLRRMRMVKSAAEIALIRFVCQAVSQAFEDLPNKLRAGDTERVAARKFQADVLHNGGEKIIYLICTSGPNGYPSISMGPTDRVLGKGDVLIIDTGVSYEGYYCDFDREFSFGPPSDQIKLAYDAAWRATEAGIKAARPGNRTQDIGGHRPRSLPSSMTSRCPGRASAPDAWAMGSGSVCASHRRTVRTIRPCSRKTWC